MRKSMGDKRREISKEHIGRITEIFLSFTDDEYSKIFDTTDFGYRKITIERPCGSISRPAQNVLEAQYAESLYRPCNEQKEKDTGEIVRGIAAGHEQQQSHSLHAEDATRHNV